APVIEIAEALEPGATPEPAWYARFLLGAQPESGATFDYQSDAPPGATPADLAFRVIQSEEFARTPRDPDLLFMIRTAIATLRGGIGQVARIGRLVHNAIGLGGKRLATALAWTLDLTRADAEAMQTPESLSGM